MRPGPHQDKVFEGFHKPMPWIELSEHVHVDWTSTASTSSQKRRTKHADDPPRGHSESAGLTVG